PSQPPTTGAPPPGPPNPAAWIALVVRSDEEFERLRELAGDALATFNQETAERIERRGEIEAALAAWAATRALEGSAAGRRGAGSCATRGNGYLGASESEALAALNAFEKVTQPESGEQRYLRVPLRLDGEPTVTQRPAPCFGQHTDEVLREWAEL